MKKQKNNIRMLGGIALGIFTAGMLLAVFGLSVTINEIDNKVALKTPNAVLANTGVSEDKLISVPVYYYDQKEDECVNLYDASLSKELKARQFEWASCGYNNGKVEQGLVEFELDENYLPVATGAGKLLPNKGVDINRWFNVVDGKSERYAGVLEMRYEANGANFIFESEDFYPLDGAEFSVSDKVNSDKHNHLFTMNLAVPFTVLASGEESFEIVADDDTFVFLGDRLVLDMGGIHDEVAGRFLIHDNGEIYVGVGDEDLAYSGLSIKADEGSIIRIYHADRDSKSSTFNVKFSGMNLSVKNTELAQGGEGIQIAYNPNNPTYVAPLGESLVSKPDSTKELIMMATIEGVVVIVSAILVVSVARFILRQKVEK